jgi:hypothetical protein
MAAADLKQVSAELEKEFMATSRTLEELNRAGEQFVQDSEMLISLAVGQSKGKKVIINSTQVVESPLLFLDDCLAESERLLHRLHEDHQSITQLLRAETNLRSTMAPLKFMQTLFKVESAPLGAEAQVMFTALTQEIERLHTQVCELFDTKFRELEMVQTILDDASVKLESQTAALRMFVTQEKVAIQNSLQQLTKELALNQQRDARIGNLSKKIAGEIMDIIVGLQFQDIINQKLEHTSAAVNQILDHAATDVETLHYLEQSCRLEAGQLQAARTDLANAEAKVKTGIQNILEHVSRADSDCLSLGEFEHITASADGMVQVLLGLIESVRKQVSTMTSRTAEIHQDLLPIHSMASGLTSVVRDLSHRIHLIGLNAQVQAAQFRKGGGLEVLSARTSEISQETNRISETIANHLDQVSSGLASSVQSFEQLHTQALFQRVELAEQGADAEKALHGLRDGSLTTLQSVGDLLKHIQNTAKATLTTITYVATADATLASLQTQLEVVAEAAALNLSGGQKSTANLDHFRQDYTMDSERQVFDHVMQGNGTPPAPPPPAGNSSEVELFTELEPLPSAPLAGEPEPPATELETFPVIPMDDSPLAPDVAPPAEPARKPSAPPPPAKGSELGDNVELF